MYIKGISSIVSAADVETIREMAEEFSPGMKGGWSVPLSSTGVEPATHYGCSGWFFNDLVDVFPLRKLVKIELDDKGKKKNKKPKQDDIEFIAGKAFDSSEFDIVPYNAEYEFLVKKQKEDKLLAKILHKNLDKANTMPKIKVLLDSLEVTDESFDDMCSRLGLLRIVPTEI